MSSSVKANLSPFTPGVIGYSFIEPDPQYLQPGANPEGRLMAQGLALAIEKGYYPKTGDEFQVIAEEGEIQKIFLDEQELVIG
jgi:hypothetical protein